MFNVTTKYDKVYDERRKVFVIRGDEAYAKTVDVVLSSTRGNHTNDRISGFPVTLIAKLYRNLGDSVLVFYDGEEPIATVDTHDFQSEYALPVRLSWGDEHKLTVRYKANAQTMGKTSKSITLQENIPSDYVPTITFTSNAQINQGTSYTATGRVQFINENVTNGTEVVVSLDGEIIDTVETSNGLFSCSLGNIDKGIHTVTAETLQSETMNAKSQSLRLQSGYDVTILKYPSTLMTGVSSEFKISVKTLEGNPVNNATVSFNGNNYTTNSQGIATFNLSSITTGDFRASYNGSYSDYVHIESVSIPTLDVTSDTVVAQNETLPIDINVNNGSGLKVQVYEGNGSSYYVTEWTPTAQVTLNKNGSATYNYDANSKGQIALKFNSLNMSEVIDITDTVGYFSASNDGTHNLKVTNYGVTNFTSSSTRNMELTFNDNGIIQLEPIIGVNNGNVLEMRIVEANTVPMYLSFVYGNRVVYECNATDILNSDFKIRYNLEGNRAIISKNGNLITMNSTDAPVNNPHWSIVGKKYSSTNPKPLKISISDLKLYKE